VNRLRDESRRIGKERHRHQPDQVDAHHGVVRVSQAPEDVVMREPDPADHQENWVIRDEA
jgi:hypothetical protein